MDDGLTDRVTANDDRIVVVRRFHRRRRLPAHRAAHQRGRRPPWGIRCFSAQDGLGTGVELLDGRAVTVGNDDGQVYLSCSPSRFQRVAAPPAPAEWVAVGDGAILAGTAKGVAISTDAGATWTLRSWPVRQ